MLAIFRGLFKSERMSISTVHTSPPAAPTRSRGCVQVSLESVQLLWRHHARSFALRVPDDAMRSIGLLQGDVAVLENAVDPRPGDVVAALVEGQSVLRVYSITHGRPMLRTADGHSAPVRADDIVIQGVMIHLLRSRAGKI